MEAGKRSVNCNYDPNQGCACLRNLFIATVSGDVNPLDVAVDDMALPALLHVALAN